MPVELNPEDTSRAAAFTLWIKAPNPIVTFFKTIDVTNLVRVSEKKHLKFNMLMVYCIGKAATGVKEFYLLPDEPCSYYIFPQTLLFETDCFITLITNAMSIWTNGVLKTGELNIGRELRNLKII